MNDTSNINVTDVIKDITFDDIMVCPIDDHQTMGFANLADLISALQSVNN